MAELQAGISYWLSVAIRAMQTFPTFIGNNWVGVLLSLILLLPTMRDQIKHHLAEIRPMAWSGKFFYTGRTLMSTNWKTILAIVGAFFIVNFLTVAFRDYGHISEQSKNTSDQLAGARATVAASAVSCQLQTNEITNQRDTERAKNQTLEQQNRDEHILIAGCQSQALKLLAPEPERITILSLDNDNEDRKKPITNTRWLLLTNRLITPVKFVVTCGTRLDSASIGAIGGSTLTVEPYRLAANSLQVEMSVPSWTPTVPLLVRTTYAGGDSVCSFVRR